MSQSITVFRVCCLGGYVALLLFACTHTGSVTEEAMPRTESSTRFVTYDNSTVLDTHTQLMWMMRDYQNLESKSPTGWPEALAWSYIINRQQYGGYGDWRVASVEEYKTIYTPTKPRLSHRGKPIGYPAAFADGGGEWCWARDLSYTEGGTTHLHDAYTFDFRIGRLVPRYTFPHAHEKPNEITGSVRLVRGPVSAAR